MGGRGVGVVGLGTALPDRIVTNHDFAATLDTTDEWIVERSGIRERRIGGTTGELATAAARAALADAGLDPSQIGMLVLCTETPDALMPATSATIARDLGLTCGSIDVNAACAGLAYGLVLAASLITAGVERVLLVGADTMASITDQGDRATAVLFADGAGALVLAASDDPEDGPLGWEAGTDGTAHALLTCPHGGTITMDGRAVFMKAVRVVAESSRAALDHAKLTPADVDLFVPHQANLRIIQSAGDRLGIPSDRFALAVATTGNTSAASIALALDAARADGRLHTGALVLASGFGAGMTWASVAWRWRWLEPGAAAAAEAAAASAVAAS